MAENHYSPEYISSLGILNNAGDSSARNNNSGFMPSGDGTFGGMSALSGKVIHDGLDSHLGLGSANGIQLGIETGTDSVFNEILGEGAFGKNLFAVFDGSVLSPFGLMKSECYAIKSLGVLMTLNSLSAAKSLNVGITGKTSIIAHEQQH